ncbi:MAG: PHP domain-containing protein [Clostridiales bacterium]|jgi:hypothetical protein|nr:PHP domain-containing protein [Clostridiales bacterium]
MTDNVNNHIHTTFSFSPYTPTEAVQMAKNSGLATVGIMDHDSVGGLREFIAAGRAIGIATTVGFECRANFAGTPFEGRYINNPDQISIAYLSMHGVPHNKIDEAETFLAPYRAARNVRNRRMVEKLGGLVRGAGLAIDFDADIVPLSRHDDGGSITERHILFALAGKIIEKVGAGPAVAAFLRETFGIEATGNNLEKLNNPESKWYQYYLLGVLKGHLVKDFYIEASAELPHVSDFVAMGDALGAIPAYAYLGDVGDSVTGDKRTQKYEDSYLDELAEFLKNTGFKAITYMPTRNTHAQLARVMRLCERHGLFEICGEDINTPFQPFVCEALRRDEYKHLITAAWALVGHERSATESGRGMFSREIIDKYPSLNARIAYFAEIGRSVKQ